MDLAGLPCIDEFGNWGMWEFWVGISSAHGSCVVPRPPQTLIRRKVAVGTSHSLLYGGPRTKYVAEIVPSGS